MSARPICAQCSRAARTVDTPLVKVRVESALVFRDASGDLQLVMKCHGSKEGPQRLVGEWVNTLDESHLEKVEAFRG